MAWIYREEINLAFSAQANDWADWAEESEGHKKLLELRKQYERTGQHKTGFTIGGQRFDGNSETAQAERTERG